MSDTNRSHPSSQQVEAYCSGKLPARDAAAFELHLSDCEHCAALVRQQQGSTLDAPAFRPAPPRDATAFDSSAIHRDVTVVPTGNVLAGREEIPADLAQHPRYHVQHLLGVGGMGKVYRAEHRVMGRAVALKVINPALVVDPVAVERFHREVKTAAKLNHPNIVISYDAEQAGRLHFLVMEFVEGVDLGWVVEKQGPLPVPTACDYLRQAALGLQHAHELGMVHRDIKPENLMLTNKGEVKILDFGLARFASETSKRGNLTESGSLMGTPDYMAPEQADDARRADIRADIYSLGCVLYFLLTGQAPFPKHGLIAKVMAHREETAKPVASFRKDVPTNLTAVVERMMAKNPAKRLQTPAEVAQALMPFTGSPDARPRRWPFALVTAGLVGLVGLAIGVAMFPLLSHHNEEVPVTENTQSETPPQVVQDTSPTAPVVAAALKWPVAALEAGQILPPDLSDIKPFLDEQFHKPRSSNWQIKKLEHVQFAIGEGTYKIQFDKGHWIYASAVPRGPWDQFACRVVGRLTNPAGYHWGINIADRNEKRGQRIAISGRGQLEVGPSPKATDTTPLPLIGPISHRAIKAGSEMNTLLVILRGRQLEVYVNEAAVCDPILLERPIAPARLALTVFGKGKGTTAEFQRVTVWPADSLPTLEARGALPKEAPP
jgi:serine/threonine protein kinase